MMDKMKVIAIAVILVSVTVVGAIIAFDGQDSKNYTVEGDLKVYGNADGNYRIDKTDLDIIEDIIADKKDFKNYPLADANHDGEIDKSDVSLVKKIINKEKCKIWHVNTCTSGNYDVETSWPVESALATGSANMLLALTYVGAEDMVHGICYSATSPPDKTLFPKFGNMKSLGTSTTKMTVDAAGDTIKENKCTAFIVDKTASTIKNEPEFEAMNVDVIRVASAVVNSKEMSSQLILLGFLFDTGDKALKIAEWQENLQKEIDNKLVGVDKVKVVTSNGSTWVSGKVSDYKDVMTAAGGIYGIPDSAFTQYGSGAYFKPGDTWLYEYDFDYLISLRTVGWYSGTIDPVAKYTDSMQNFTKTEAYENGNAYVVTGDGPISLRVAYTATVLYPEIFSTDWADEKNKEFFKTFYPHDIDFEDLYFIIGPDKGIA